MSLIILGNSSEPFALEIPKLRRNSEGWDEVRELVRAPNQQFLDTGEARSFLGHITGTFFVQDLQCVGCQFGKPVMEVISRGVAGTKGVIWEGTSYSEIQTAENVVGVPGAPFGSFVRVSVAVGNVGMTARYVSVGAPPANETGTAMIPAVNFGVPAYPFGSAPTDKVVYHLPVGWRLAKRDSKQLPGTNYYFNADYFMYQHSPTL